MHDSAPVHRSCTFALLPDHGPQKISTLIILILYWPVLQNLLNQLGDRSHLGLDSDVEPRHFDPAPAPACQHAPAPAYYPTICSEKKNEIFLTFLLPILFQVISLSPEKKQIIFYYTYKVKIMREF